MKRIWIVCALLWTCGVLAASGDVKLAEPWEAAYAGDDARGGHVIALWDFDGDQARDVSGHGHDGKVQGSAIRPEGRFGGCLESFPGFPTAADRKHAVVVPSAPSLTPRGAFTVEMWISAKPEFDAAGGDAFLLDKKYVADADYQLVVARAGRSASRTLRASLGFGGESSTWHSEPVKFDAGTWHHVAFTYDGAGTLAFFVDGNPAGGGTIAGRKGVAAGGHPLSIGDRVGSNYHGFPGYIDEVRISDGVREFRRVKFERISDRGVFVRMEAPATAGFLLTNLRRQPLEEATASLSMPGSAEKQVKLAKLLPGQNTTLEFPLDTSLRPDEYILTARVSSGGENPIRSEEAFTIRVVPRPLPDQFPVVMWGVYGGVGRETERLKRIGFTHVLGLGADYGRIWRAGQATEPADDEDVARNRAMLDEALANGLTVAANLSPGKYLEKQKDMLRVDREGHPQEKRPNICALDPRAEKFCADVGRSVAAAYGRFPAFGAALIHTEIRDSAAPCFHSRDFDAYRAATGREIPPEVGGRAGVDYAKLTGFPADRIIPDDHPLYGYYKWYWKHGDGWNGLNSAVARGLRAGGRADFWSWNDPAVRVAKVYGSGGDVDVISHWTYSYPDPIRIAVATDELLAMAGGAERKQDVMSMTQVIWYRSQTAPIPDGKSPPPAYQADWERAQPDAPFITIAPMHLREAFWTKIARPIRGIMYHGWQSLVPCEPVSSYRYTNPQTQNELARLVREVVRPLGPTLRNVPGVRSDVAFLESFASEMFARRGTYGWGGKWAGDAYHVLMYAHLQPEIVFDETIASRGLEGYRVLVMPDCDVLTATVAARVREFQARGGIVVGDDHLAPGIRPDVVLNPYTRTGRNDRDKKALLALAAELRTKLDGRYTRAADTSDPDVIPYRRRYESADYVFLVNDRREYGDYVGHHGIVMENGIPAAATVSIGREGGAVYDLLEGREVPTRKEGGRLAWDAALGPCDGRLYAVLDQPIAGVGVRVPESAERGGTVRCDVEVSDGDGKPVRAVLPVEVLIRDPQGRAAEFSGFYAAAGGRLQIDLRIAPNDTFGVWEVRAKELASGRTASGAFRVNGPKEWPPQRGAVPKELANPVQPKG